MAVKTFTSEILTSSDTNTYLANAGLVYVTSATIGSAVSTVTVSSAFNTTYDAYKIVVSDGISSVDGRLRMTLGATVTGYYWGLIAGRYDNGGAVSVGGSNAALWDYIGIGSGAGLSVNIDLINPFLSKKTTISAAYTDPGSGAGTGAGWSSGQLNNSTSYTSFILSPASGTLTGGTITVYGYRKA
jgi:hypothetical protein